MASIRCIFVFLNLPVCWKWYLLAFVLNKFVGCSLSIDGPHGTRVRICVQFVCNFHCISIDKNQMNCFARAHQFVQETPGCEKIVTAVATTLAWIGKGESNGITTTKSIRIDRAWLGRAACYFGYRAPNNVLYGAAEDTACRRENVCRSK